MYKDVSIYATEKAISGNFYFILHQEEYLRISQNLVIIISNYIFFSLKQNWLACSKAHLDITRLLRIHLYALQLLHFVLLRTKSNSWMSCNELCWKSYLPSNCFRFPNYFLNCFSCFSKARNMLLFFSFNKLEYFKNY